MFKSFFYDKTCSQRNFIRSRHKVNRFRFDKETEKRTRFFEEITTEEIEIRSLPANPGKSRVTVGAAHDYLFTKKNISCFVMKSKMLLLFELRRSKAGKFMEFFFWV